jgi:hypothetical protein
MKLPAGTIYAKGKPWYFEELIVKGETFGNDWATLQLVDIKSDGTEDWIEKLETMKEIPASSYPINDAYGRDGCFDNYDIFLVYEKNDLEVLRGYIDCAMTI